MNAAMRCGHAYVPLDADDPRRRLRFVLRDCAPLAILADGPSVAGRRWPTQAAPSSRSRRQVADPRSAMPPVAPDALANVFYVGVDGRAQGRDARTTPRCSTSTRSS